MLEVGKYIWDHHESELRRSGDLFYKWQYDMRWAANHLRKTGVMKPVSAFPTGVPEERSIMVSKLGDEHGIADYLVDKAVLIVDTPGPVARQRMF